MDELTQQMVDTIRDAARKMTGPERRAFEVKVCWYDLYGDARISETVFGWSRHTVAKGLNEYQIGKIIEDQPRAGKLKTEEKNPHLANDICDLMEPNSQTAPNVQSLFKDTRMTARAAHQAPIEEKDYTDEELPSENTIGVMLNRMNDKLRRVQKAKPEKNQGGGCYLGQRESDERGVGRVRRLLAGLHGYHGDLEIGRAFTTRSITRTRSRQGAGQGSECQREVRSIGKNGRSQRRVDRPLRDFTRETSDFIVDCLENWWEDRKDQHTHIRELVINLDNGPELGSGRRQFIQRMIEFAN